MSRSTTVRVQVIKTTTEGSTSGRFAVMPSLSCSFLSVLYPSSPCPIPCYVTIVFSVVDLHDLCECERTPNRQEGYRVYRYCVRQTRWGSMLALSQEQNSRASLLNCLRGDHRNLRRGFGDLTRGVSESRHSVGKTRCRVRVLLT